MPKFKVGDKVYCPHHSLPRLIGDVIRIDPPKGRRMTVLTVLVKWPDDDFSPIPYSPDELRLADNGIERARKIICSK